MDYSDIKEGTVFSFIRNLSQQDVQDFAKLSGDFNKLHVDPVYGKQSVFGQNVVHGMLCGSLFSQLVGMHCPGENSIYLTQSLQFKRPVFYGDTVTVQGTVMRKNDSIRVITLKTEVLKDGKVAVDGEAKVKVTG
jgi:3-hydroxybutyryl-CoA dehydratase